MKELLPVISDDLIWAETQERTPAERVVSVGFMGQWWELDLTGAHYNELSLFLDRYVRAGRRTTTPAKVQANMQPARSDAEAMRAWADETGFRTRKDGPPYHPSNDGKGGYYHTRDLKRAWAAHKAQLEATGGLGSDRPQ